ncbi:RDD family protein [Alkalihalophilus lindianensis]|uniref:RDD family protein n=1 Tax=Alkalihalophilus lindianensis TaxID=1630542 RepID=A0ABU3XA45_9BACI|nr:RDD family protein [Alkalihalophilus lindianensis]MDV2684760.1 RDD family protein [Alkalihalophilus lindianensis]
MEQGMINRGSRPRRARLLQQRKQRQERPIQEEPVQHAEVEKELDHYYAGFWMRLWAFTLDSLMLLSLRWLLLGPILNLTDIRYTLGAMYGVVDFIVSALFFFAYFALMTKYYGATIGKMVFGLRVVTMEGTLLSWKDVLFREGIGRILHQSFGLLYILYITIAFTSKKQGLHDMIANSYVIHER